MPTTLGAAARHPAGQLAGVDDAAGFAGAVDDEDDEEDSDEPDEDCEPLDDFSEDPEPLVAEPAVTVEPARESVR
jgi:hypothetical protein